MEKKLRSYAKLLVRKGVNVQKGQVLFLNCSVDNAYFARLVQEEAYAIGVKEVVMNWSDSISAKNKFLYADDSIFDEFEPWRASMLNHYADSDAAFLSITGDNPEALKGIDSSKAVRAQQASAIHLKDYREKMMSDKLAWSIGAVASVEWARKVFPNEDDETAVKLLWDAIFMAVRVDKEDPVAAWDKHLVEIKAAVDFLNDKNFEKLIFKNSIGTDLEIGLADGHIWAGGGGLAGANQVETVANMPTEEVFTMPKRNFVNGKVVSTKPLSYQGQLIDGFEIEFKDGKAISVKASQGQEVLESMIGTDEGAAYLGEVALVPYHSPISLSNILFYNTLFDENASCHLAFGKAYPTNITQTEGDTAKSLAEKGMNDSIIHVDFMIGSSDLSVKGITKDGEEIDVLINGDYAFLK